ncbi:lipoprotein-releasing system ATP-binding protein LolD [Taibaiella sp. KBW10]|uniref:ABC transporter ATP-binding protein n=1 Tax=Taibaiella sp. KBW10 TaxID=2153357 RepID=UPI000F5AB0C3|nr:ABC transporter ATP-binding protein [Taibaiella sp. KBW10]RQO31773.1 lipoprotein-releasing system ATP-binding protein LolD [Taibaiella sp. KBW10]
MLLQATHLSKSYGNLQVLKNVSLQIDKGSFVAIVGPSGAGKSTLLQILGLLDSPNKGSVQILSTPLENLSSKKQAAFRNKNIGFVFQSHHLLPEFTALENVCMPLWIAGTDKETAQQEATKVLTQVGLAHRIDHKPSALSGGEQQRVAIARALVQKPVIIFADEPTGNLDTATADAVNKLFLELKEQYQLTFVVVTHNEQLAALANRVLSMKDGEIVSDSADRLI